MSADNQQSFKLGKAARLQKPADYQRVYRSKQWGGSEHHSFNVLAGTKRALGVTVSKKVSKLAVQRNRLRRQIKEFYRQRQHQLIDGVELVITAKPSSANASQQQLLASIEALWQKVLKWQRWHQRQQQNQPGCEESDQNR